MTKDEQRAVTFMAILLGLALAARVLSRPAPVVVDAAPVDIEAFRKANRAVAGRDTSKRRRDLPAVPKGPIDLNRATAAELERLPGVGPAMAQRIVTHRDSIRGFKAVEDLDSVKGIGPKLIEKLRPLVKVR